MPERGAPCASSVTMARVSDLIDTTEMYLRTIYELDEEGIVPLRARIAERLHQSGPTVSQTVARMERDGLAHRRGRPPPRAHRGGPPARHPGDAQAPARRAAAHRRHRAALGAGARRGLPLGARHVRGGRAHGCIELLDQPTESPYGNPIPGLAELGADGGRGRSWRAWSRSTRSCGGAPGADADPADQRGGPEGRGADGRAAPGRCTARPGGRRPRPGPEGVLVGLGRRDRRDRPRLATHVFVRPL